MEAFSRAVFNQYCFASISARRRFYERFNTSKLTQGIFQSVSSASLSLGVSTSAGLGSARLGSVRLPGWGQTASPFTEDTAKQQQLDTSERLPPITAAPSFY